MAIKLAYNISVTYPFQSGCLYIYMLLLVGYINNPPNHQPTHPTNQPTNQSLLYEVVPL